MNPSPPSDAYPEHFERGIRALLDHGHAAGADALGPIAQHIWTTKLRAAPLVRDREPRMRGEQRRFTPTMSAATFKRDRFQCRYCTTRLLPVPLMALVSIAYPDLIPYVDTYRLGAMHPAFWTRGAEADHIRPVDAGGSSTDPDNFASACASCNTRKGHSLLSEIGWVEHPPADAAWDGLLPLYRPLWETLDRPASHDRWVRAFEGAGA